MTISKLRLLTAAIVAVGLLAIANVATAEMRFDGVTLRVGTWGGPWGDMQKKHIKPKLEALGAKVEYVHGSTQDNVAKLIAAKGRTPPIDVFEILDAMEPVVAQGDFLQKLDLAKIPNIKDLADWQYDDTKVATWIVQEGICYNTEKFKELGVAAPATYKDLGDPKLKRRVTIPDISSGGGLANFAGLVYAGGGNEKNVKPGLILINQINPLKFWRNAQEVVVQLKASDVYAAVIHTGWCVRAKKAGVPVAAVHPRINASTQGVLKTGWIGVVKGSKNREAAQYYINEFVSKEFQSAFAAPMGVIPVNKQAVSAFTSDTISVSMYKADMSDILRINYSDADVADWIDQWTRSVAK